MLIQIKPVTAHFAIRSTPRISFNRIEIICGSKSFRSQPTENRYTLLNWFTVLINNKGLAKSNRFIADRCFAQYF